MALDRFGRDIHYLRISLTDHCNLRCVYCMPEDMTFRPNKEMMQDDELLLLVRLFAGLGFDKLRLTGGEPTVRAGIVDLVREIRATPGIEQLTMTTNGVLLGKLAAPLKAAGMQRVNISLDTLDPDKFKRLTRWGSFDQVWDGIIAAENAGLTPIKLNAVVVRGYNDEDVVELAGLTYEHPWQVRYIEMMPFAGATELQQSQVVRAEEMIERIQKTYGPLSMLNHGELDGEARIYRLPDALGDDRLYLLGLAAILRHLHPCTADCGRQTAAVPAARKRSGPAHPAARGGHAGRPAQVDPGWHLV